MTLLTDLCGLTIPFRIDGKPHIYKKAGMWRIALPEPPREYWYFNLAQVFIFLKTWSNHV